MISCVAPESQGATWSSTFPMATVARSDRYETDKVVVPFYGWRPKREAWENQPPVKNLNRDRGKAQPWLWFWVPWDLEQLINLSKTALPFGNLEYIVTSTECWWADGWMDGRMDRWMLFSKLQSQSILLPHAFYSALMPTYHVQAVVLGWGRQPECCVSNQVSQCRKQILRYLCIMKWICLFHFA